MSIRIVRCMTTCLGKNNSKDLLNAAMDGLDLKLYRAPGSKEGDKFVKFRNLPDISDTHSRNGSLNHAATDPF